MKRYGTKQSDEPENSTSRPAKKRAGKARKPATKPAFKTDPYAEPKKKIKNDKNIKTTGKGKMGT
ncbi:MAG: hypothetical protein ACXVPQ_07585 [Bacteroidia bacterium]